jgi:hypothetical protein
LSKKIDGSPLISFSSKQQFQVIKINNVGYRYWKSFPTGSTKADNLAINERFIGITEILLAVFGSRLRFCASAFLPMPMAKAILSLRKLHGLIMCSYHAMLGAHYQ